MLIRAARELGCSVLDLMEHPHMDYWVAAALTHAQYEAWLQDRADRRR